MGDFREIKHIPVYSGPEKKEIIGRAEIKQDGGITITIDPGVLLRNPDIRAVEQIQGFDVSYTYIGMPKVAVAEYTKFETS